jgi:tyrosyl-tRNA synthetase
MKSDFLKLLQERGYINQCTNLDELDKVASKEIVVGYIGFDATAKSLHVGSLVQIMMLRMMQKSGHKPVILMGGGTTKIGDPSGKDEARKMLTDEIIEENKASIAKVFKKYIKFGDGPTDAIMVDNAEWLDSIKYIEFLRDYGKHFTINRMLTFDSVKLRLDREQPLTFLEFNYMLLQSYDFVELYQNYNCRLQMGGSDQWGNIISGADLGRRMGHPEMFGLTSHLITTKSGAKMGKSANGAMWLDAEMLSPYDFWQFWRNTEDGDVGRFLSLFTELPLDEVNRLAKLGGKEINDAKIVLANEVTKLCHGEEAALNAMETAKKTFEEGASGDELPIIEIAESELGDGMPAFKIFMMSGLCSSGGEARRLIKGKGGKFNNEVVLDENELITSNKFTDNGGELKVSFGQKKHVILKIK